MHLDVANFGEWDDQFHGAYIGEYDDIADYAVQLVDDCGLLEGVADSVKRYFDYESYGRDLINGGDIWQHDKHLFWNR
jgi:antirestriction protein